MGNYSMCICFPKKFGVSETGPPVDVKEVFMEYAEGGACITVEQLRRFLVEVQGDAEAEASMEDAERIVEEVLQRKHNNVKFTSRALSLEDFYFYLFSVDLNPFLLNKVEICSCFFFLVFCLAACDSKSYIYLSGEKNPSTFQCLT